jgi:type II secretory pathway pseudopilin PulG
MSTFSDSPRRRQCGSTLLESLVAVAVTGFIGAGTASIAARIAVSQHELRVEGLAVSQLRQMLNRSGEGLCGTSGNRVILPGAAQVDMTIACDAMPPQFIVQPSVNDPAAPVTVTVNAVRPVTASVRLDALGLKAEAADATIVVGTQQ